MFFIRIIILILLIYFFILNIRFGLYLSWIFMGYSILDDNLLSFFLCFDNGELEIVINFWVELFYVILKLIWYIFVFVYLMEWCINNGILEDEFICWGFLWCIWFFESCWCSVLRDVGNLERYIECICDNFFLLVLFFLYKILL